MLGQVARERAELMPADAHEVGHVVAVHVGNQLRILAGIDIRLQPHGYAVQLSKLVEVAESRAGRDEVAENLHGLYYYN